MKKIMSLLMSLIILLSPTAVLAQEGSIEFILDWVPNTNHTSCLLL
ncbi:hypothetical protein ACF3NG_10985 [Aerococcaceae bacterium WGS1372]